MLVAGIIGQDGIVQTANLVNAILTSTGKKVSIIDAKILQGMDSKMIRSYIFELGKNNVDILVLKIDIADAGKEVFDNVHFDIMIYTDKADVLKEADPVRYREVMRRAFALLDEKGIAIVNVDDSELLQFLESMKYHFVTYGFNSKASITASSIGDTLFDDNFLFSLQRTIATKSGFLVEPQEYRIKLENHEQNAHNVLAAATFAIVNGVDLNKVNPSDMK